MFRSSPLIFDRETSRVVSAHRVRKPLYRSRKSKIMTHHFYLNDQEVCTDEPAGMLVLDFVRRHAKLTGTKEGCREGDCGACVVLIGERTDDRVTYQPVTACLVPLGEVHGKHVVTIEGLQGEALTPVQDAIVEEGATQCGFCTPGIVVSLTGYVMQDAGSVTRDGVKEALSGHLCRCTGYRSLKATAPLLQDTVGATASVEALVDQGLLPAYFRAMPERLRRIGPPAAPNGQATPDVAIAGGTDLYVQRGDDLPEASVHVLNLHPEMKRIVREADVLRVGASTTFEAFARHPAVQAVVPSIRAYMFLIASWQIRNRATLGGNLVNASPIGDMTVLLLALNARLVLQDRHHSRTVPLRTFYQGYKQLDKTPTEILTEILIPLPAPSTRINWEKVSKRLCLDIASVNSAIHLRCEGGVIREAGLAMGGVAPVPLFMARTSAALVGKPLSTETVEAAFSLAQEEIAPISDVRGSAAYKRLLVRQLLMAHFAKLFPEHIRVEAFY